MSGGHLLSNDNDITAAQGSGTDQSWLTSFLSLLMRCLQAKPQIVSFWSTDKENPKMRWGTDFCHFLSSLCTTAGQEMRDDFFQHFENSTFPRAPDARSCITSVFAKQNANHFSSNYEIQQQNESRSSVFSSWINVFIQIGWPLSLFLEH